MVVRLLRILPGLLLVRSHRQTRNPVLPLPLVRVSLHSLLLPNDAGLRGVRLRRRADKYFPLSSSVPLGDVVHELHAETQGGRAYFRSGVSGVLLRVRDLRLPGGFPRLQPLRLLQRESTSERSRIRR